MPPQTLIQVSAPAKLILFGEWAVLDGAPAVATTLQTRFFLEQRPLNDLLLNSIRLRSLASSRDADAKVLDWHFRSDKNPSGFFNFAMQVLRLIYQDEIELLAGQELLFRREWQLSEGLGSSSALVLCALLASFQSRKTIVPDKFELWQQGRKILRQIQGRASGLDLAAQIFETTLVLEHEHIQTLPLNFPPELVLVHTGNKMSTGDELKKNRQAVKPLEAIAQSSARFLKQRDWVLAMHEHMQALNELGVVPSEINAAQAEWTAAGFIEAVKTTGAGGGDGLLVWLKHAQLENFQKNLKQRGWWLSPYAWTSQNKL